MREGDFVYTKTEVDDMIENRTPIPGAGLWPLCVWSHFAVAGWIWSHQQGGSGVGPCINLCTRPSMFQLIFYLTLYFSRNRRYQWNPELRRCCHSHAGAEVLKQCMMRFHLRSPSLVPVKITRQNVSDHHAELEPASLSWKKNGSNGLLAAKFVNLFLIKNKIDVQNLGLIAIFDSSRL